MVTPTNKVRVLLTKSQMDAHDRGVRYMARKLMEAGFEVIFTRYGLPEEVVRTAVEEDVDVVGVSFSTGGHLVTMSEVEKGLRKQGREDILLLVGGIIPQDEEPKLLKLGVKGAFGPGTNALDVIRLIQEYTSPKRG